VTTKLYFYCGSTVDVHVARVVCGELHHLTFQAKRISVVQAKRISKVHLHQFNVIKVVFLTILVHSEQKKTCLTAICDRY